MVNYEKSIIHLSSQNSSRNVTLFSQDRYYAAVIVCIYIYIALAIPGTLSTQPAFTNCICIHCRSRIYLGRSQSEVPLKLPECHMITRVRSDCHFGALISKCVYVPRQYWISHHNSCCFWENWILNVHGANLNLHSVFRSTRTRIFHLYSSDTCSSCLTPLSFIWVRHLEKHAFT